MPPLLRLLACLVFVVALLPASALAQEEPADFSTPQEDVVDSGEVPDVTGSPIAATAYRAASPEYGVSIFPFFQPDTTARDFSLVAGARFQWAKVIFPWRAIEGEGKGQFTWDESDRLVAAARDAGVKLIARLDFQPRWARADQIDGNGPPDNPQDYGDFVGAFVARYATDSPFGHVDAIQVWNEPNIAREWGNQQPDAGQYVALLQAAYQAARAADPSVVVISAPPTPTGTWTSTSVPDDMWLANLYQSGVQGFFDALGAHGPGYKAPPEMSAAEVAADPSFGGHPSFAFRRIEQLRQIMVDNGDDARQVWVLEFGWTSDTVHPEYSWYGVSEDTKADYLVRAYQYAQQNWSPWIGTMVLWNVAAPYWTQADEQYWWSITNADGTPRPAYAALQSARENGALP